MNESMIVAGTVSDGWLSACRLLLDARGAEINHLVVRMTAPLPEDPAARAKADAFIAEAGHAPISEVRNTIFPAAMAERFTEPAELVDAYMADYGLRKSLAGGQGTYFGRLCEFPLTESQTVSQLVPLVDKLKAARDGTRWKARYQLNVHSESVDHRKKRGYFPCMAHIGFQLGYTESASKPDRLDCVALYRNQDITVKGYGNYLGIAELQRYLAEATGFSPGELLVVAGHAELSLSGADRARLTALVAETS